MAALRGRGAGPGWDGGRGVAPAGPLRSAAFPPGLLPRRVKKDLLIFRFVSLTLAVPHCEKPAPRPSRWLSFPAWKAPE